MVKTHRKMGELGGRRDRGGEKVQKRGEEGKGK